MPLKKQYTHQVKTSYSVDGIGRVRMTAAPKGNAQQTLRQKDRYPTKLRKAMPQNMAPTRQFRNHGTSNSIAGESFRFRYGARDFVRASCFLFPKNLKKSKNSIKPEETTHDTAK